MICYVDQYFCNCGFVKSVNCKLGVVSITRGIKSRSWVKRKRNMQSLSHSVTKFFKECQIDIKLTESLTP